MNHMIKIYYWLLLEWFMEAKEFHCWSWLQKTAPEELQIGFRE